MKIEWRTILATVAPVLATAAGGPLAGVVTKTLAAKLLQRPDAKPDEVEAAIAGADPATLLRLKEIDLEFEKELQQAGVKLEEIAAEDRASARAREVALKDHTPAVLAYAITIGFFGTLAYMLMYGKPATGGDALLVMLGALGGAWGAIVSYFFGSSAGSKLKTEAMAKR
jgi:hypothetical protein